MRRLPPAPLLVLALCSVTAAAAAEFSPLVEDRAPAQPAASPTLTRTVSPAVAEMLGHAAPRFEAIAAAQPAQSEPAAEEKPRNGIIRLSPYFVREKQPPEFKARELLTETSRRELAFKRSPGLRFGSFGPLSNNVWADALLEQDLSIERQKEMYELMSLAQPGQRRPIFHASVPFGLPLHFSGPEAGLVVPWERR